MRRIGLIGGTSWESTLVYYKRLNEGARARAGGLSSAPLVLTSVDFAPLEALMAQGAWDRLGAALADEARRLEAAGAQCVALCTNTMHKVADVVRAATALPFLDIRDATGAALAARGAKRPLLLGTRYAMEDGFFVDHLRARGFAPSVPNAADRARLNAVIFDELCLGRVEPASRSAALDIVARGLSDGADSVILGCTEIMLLIGQGDVAAPVIDTMAAHVDAALAFSFADSSQPKAA
jgi:aspartate racemase